MKPSSLVGHVLEVLDTIERRDKPADHVVQEFFRRRHYLGSKDRRFIADTVFDMLRHHVLVRFYAEHTQGQLGMGSLPLIARYVAYAIRIRNSTPSEVLSAVEAHWRFSFPSVDSTAFLEAVANAPAPSVSVPEAWKRIAIEYSMPEFIAAQWCERFGEEEATQLCAALNRQAPTVIRVNTLKASREECRRRLAAEGIASEPTRLSPFGLVLAKRITVSALKSFREGWFELQDEGSQLLSLLVDPQPGETVVDACAGGGGKTLHLAALMQNRGTLFTFDVEATRLRNIAPRLLRAGVRHTLVCDAEKERDRLTALRGKADAVLLDAPCSGTGTFRRNPGAKLMVEKAYVAHMVKTQLSVLATFAPLVREGGRLVYATCSLLQEENEEVIRTFLGAHHEFALEPPAPVLAKYGVDLASDATFLLLLPHKTGTDGFFAAVMRKRT
ncbi:MAG: RNA methyltransferase [Ignavibacteria bacterium]